MSLSARSFRGVILNSHIKNRHVKNRLNISFARVWFLLFGVIGLSSIFSLTSAYAQESLDIDVNDNTLTVEIINANLPSEATRPGSSDFKTEKLRVKQPSQPIARVVWLPSEYGVLPQEKVVAQQLAKLGIESWFVDFYEALFLSPTPSAVDKINPQWTAQLITQAQRAQRAKGAADKKIPVWIIAPNKAAQIAVRGLQSILQKPINHLGLILINPNLYLQTPLPGLVADYWPQSGNVNLPVSVIQAELSPWKWRLNELNQQLQQAGSDVFTQIIPDVRDRFYFREDALEIENQRAKTLANTLAQAMRLQLAYLSKNRLIKPLHITVNNTVNNKLSHEVNQNPNQENSQPKASKSLQLSAYKGAQDLALNLKAINGKNYDLTAEKGKVILVNFWASWCPPCVHEMPSMARLKTHFKNRKFEILAVNLGEDSKTIQTFLREHPVNFPVLLDSDAKAVKDWKVFAYPSSYLIDKNGKIRLALFGATQWDDLQHLTKIEALLAE